MTKYILIIATILLAVSCAENIPVQECLPEESYGFWMGLVHGIIAPFTFIIGLFNEEVAVYAVNNNGSWYDFGFLMGAGVFLGGSGRGSKRK